MLDWESFFLSSKISKHFIFTPQEFFLAKCLRVIRPLVLVLVITSLVLVPVGASLHLVNKKFLTLIFYIETISN